MLLVVGGIVSLDQISKYYIARTLPLHHSIELIPHLLQLIHIRNTGIAFGMLASRKGPIYSLSFIIISLLAIILLGYLYCFSYRKRLPRIALLLILGGAIGNLIDRVLYQEVLDFIDLHWYQYHWPAFNIADTCITLGIGFLIYDAIKR